MKKSLLPVSAIAICAAVLAGCEWGGVHSGESWNDAYSWANFTGTYKLVNKLVSTTTTTTTTTTSSDGTTTTTTDTDTKGDSDQAKNSVTFTIAKNAKSAVHNLSPNKVVPGTTDVSLTATEDNVSHSWKDKEGNGVLNYNSKGGASLGDGTITYDTGHITIPLSGMGQHPELTCKVNYSYYTEGEGGGSGGGEGGSGGGEGGGSGKKGPPITWLNLNQKGNLLSFQDSNGTTYSGKITGASVPKEDEGGYMMSGHIRFTFEATCNQNTRITLSGSISGDYSGSTSKTGGVLANRTIDAIYHSGSGGTAFQAVSGSTTVYPKEVSAASGVTE